MSYLVKVEGTLEELARLFKDLDVAVKKTKSVARKTKSVARKIKRKTSPYQKEVGRQLKKLKAKHPRTPVTSLMKKAHRAAKKARK